MAMTAPGQAFTDGSSKVPIVIAIPTTLTSLAIICVALRFWVKRTRRGGLWIDDWLIVVALSMDIVASVLIMRQIPRGYGQHLTTAPSAENLMLIARDVYVAQIFYLLANGTCKISILFFYLRLTRTLKLQYAVWVTMGFVIASTMALMVGNVLECKPIAYTWNPSVPGGNCFNRWAFWASSATINVVTDLAVYTLPIPTIWSMKLMPRRQKIGLVLVFGFGLITIAAGFVRLSAMVRHDMDLALAKHSTWDYLTASLSFVTELNIGIMGSCLPSLKPLFGRFLASGPESPASELNEVRLSDHNPNNSAKSRTSEPDDEDGGHLYNVDSHQHQQQHKQQHSTDENINPSLNFRLPFSSKPVRRDASHWYASALEGTVGSVTTPPLSAAIPTTSRSLSVSRNGDAGEWPASYGHNNRVSNHEVSVKGNYNSKTSSSPPGSSSSSDEELPRHRGMPESTAEFLRTARPRSRSVSRAESAATESGGDDGGTSRKRSDSGNVILKTTRISVSRSASVSGHGG